MSRRLSSLSDEEFLAWFQSKSQEERDRMKLLDIGDHYKAVKKGKKSFIFLVKYEKLKRCMKLHRWDKDYILSRFGVSYKELTVAYFSAVNS